MTADEKLLLMSQVVKPIIALLDNRMNNKLEALKAYDGPINQGSDEVKRMREIEAIKLRHEVDVLRDIKTIVQAMYPNT